MATKFAKSKSDGLPCVGDDAGTSEIHAKADQHCRANLQTLQIISYHQQSSLCLTNN